MKVIESETLEMIHGGLNLSALQWMMAIYGCQGLAGGAVLAMYKALGGPGGECLPHTFTCLIAPAAANVIGAHLFMNKLSTGQ